MTGRIGEIHPAVLEVLELRTDRVIVAELAIAGLSVGSPRQFRATALPRHQAVERDLAVVLPAIVPAADSASAIREAAGPVLASLRLFDVYRGAPLGPDERSMAYRLQLQAPDRALTEDEVDAVIHAVMTRLGRLGGRRRE
jgi:phenylalanyl-tRNA synthetase beta chain